MSDLLLVLVQNFKNLVKVPEGKYSRLSICIECGRPGFDSSEMPGVTFGIEAVVT